MLINDNVRYLLFKLQKLHVKTITTKSKERMMQKAKCTICGKKKNKFIKMKNYLNDNKN